MKRSLLVEWLYIGGLVGVMALGIFSATPFPQDDHFSYQQFIEALARGQLDLSVPGFHGSDIFAVPWYILSHSPIAQIDVLRVWAIALPVIAYVAGVRLFGTRADGVLLASVIAMMPFVSFVALRGWTGPAYWGLMLLTVAAAAGGSVWVAVPFGLAMLTKPFAIALAPLLWVLLRRRRQPKNNSLALPGSARLPDESEPRRSAARAAWLRASEKEKVHSVLVFCGAFALCAGYIAIQYCQAGRIFVGTHADVGVLSVFSLGRRFFLNIAHAFQILFSIHNYYFPDPSKTGPGNLLHTSPVLMFLGLYALGRSREFFRDLSVPFALGIGAVVGLGLNALLDHMDHFYMEAGILLLILAALPLLRQQLLWVILTLATLHFQWWYFFLQYGSGFHLPWQFFLIPLYVDAAFLLFCCWHLRKILASVRAIVLIPFVTRG